MRPGDVRLGWSLQRFGGSNEVPLVAAQRALPFSDEQVPWLTLPGSRRFYVGEAGIVSIQLANENSEGDLARRSNVVNKRLGFDTAGAELPSPAPLPTVTPQPVPEGSVTRPVSPSVSLVEVLANGDDLKVSLSSAWSGNLEYRIWAHTGRYPGGSGGWKPLSVSGDSFIVSGVSGERGWWWAQARAAAGADGLVGEPTAAKSFYLDPPPPVRPTPMPAHFPTATRCLIWTKGRPVQRLRLFPAWN